MSRSIFGGFSSSSNPSKPIILIQPEWHYKQETYRTIKSETFTISEQPLRDNTDGSRTDVGKNTKEKCSQKDKKYKSDLYVSENNSDIELPLLGFNYRTKDERPVVIWADIPTIPHVLEALNTANIEDLKKDFVLDNNNLNVTELLKNKLNINNLDKLNQSVHSIFDRCVVSLPDDNGSKNIQVQLFKRDQPQSFIQFELAATNGHLISNGGNKFFKSRIEVASSIPDEEPFLIDIRQLFFTDMHEITSEIAFQSTERISLDEIIAQDGAKIKLRQKKDHSSTTTLTCVKGDTK